MRRFILGAARVPRVLRRRLRRGRPACVRAARRSGRADGRARLGTSAVLAAGVALAAAGVGDARGPAVGLHVLPVSVPGAVRRDRAPAGRAGLDPPALGLRLRAALFRRRRCACSPSTRSLPSRAGETCRSAAIPRCCRPPGPRAQALRIVHLSDIQTHEIGPYQERVIAAALAEQPGSHRLHRRLHPAARRRRSRPARPRTSRRCCAGCASPRRSARSRSRGDVDPSGRACSTGRR